MGRGSAVPPDQAVRMMTGKAIRWASSNGVRSVSYNEGGGPFNFMLRRRSWRVSFYVAIGVGNRFLRLYGGLL